MFGFPMRVELDELAVVLRPPKKQELMEAAEKFGSLVVHMYTAGISAKTDEDEAVWWKKQSEAADSITWCIVPEGEEKPIGITGLNAIHPFWGCCTSGIIIYDQGWWGRGVAYRAHLARTWYTVRTLNRTSIQSSVRTQNPASLKALLKVGYRISGIQDRNCFRNGEYMDTYILSWINPFRAVELYPKGVPAELDESLGKAREALELADEIVKYL